MGAKVKIINNGLQVLNLLVKEGTTNKNVQLLPKASFIVDKDLLTDQAKRLRDLSVISVLPYTEMLEI